MANTDKFFSSNKKAASRKTKKEEKQVTYSKNELKGLEVVRDDTGKIDKKASYYCVSLRFPKDYEADMKDRAWETKQTVTEYMNSLVEADLKAHGRRV